MLRGYRHVVNFCVVCEPVYLKSKVVSVLIVLVLMSFYMIAIGNFFVVIPTAQIRMIAPAQSSWSVVRSLVLNKIKLQTREFDALLRLFLADPRQIRTRCMRTPSDRLF